MQPPYAFGRFVFDPDKMALFDDGEPVRVGKIELKILKILIERQRIIVPKSELMSLVWDNAIVGDNALHVHVAGLRRALGDDVISTKRGFGYRFSAVASQRDIENKRAGNLQLMTADAASSPALIGRDNDLQHIVKLMRTARLVSLTGPGGVGKTSLGLRAAKTCAPAFPDGVWLVELSSLQEPKIVASQIAASLGLGLGKTPNPVQKLGRLLREKNLLLVLDNCEHLADACGELCEIILSATSNVKILVTSRHALSCAGEIIFAVQPLAVPSSSSLTAAEARKSAAFELFRQRAREVANSFEIDDTEVEIATQICRRVDGPPLAIEMVASWAAIFGLDVLGQKLGGSVNSWPRARNTAPLRQSTLMATLEWSHELLSSHEQIVLRRLAVFSDAFTTQAAEAVVSDDDLKPSHVFEVLAGLIRKSMVSVVPDAKPPTYRLLETARAFMAEKLAAAPEAHSVRRRHANYVLDTLRSAIEELESVSDAVWQRRYASLLPDVRSSSDWAIEGEPELAIALADVAWPLWREMSLHVEGRQRLNAIVGLIGPETPPALGLRARRGLAGLRLNTESVSTAYNSLLEVVSIYRALQPGPELGIALCELSYSALAIGRFDDSRKYITESIELLRYSGMPRELGKAYTVLMSLEIHIGRYAECKQPGLNAIQLCEAVGADRTAFTAAANLLEATILLGNLTEALSAGQDLAMRLRAAPYSDILGQVLGLISCTLILQEKHEESLPVLREAVVILREEEMAFWLYPYLALRLAIKGRYSDAAVVGGFAIKTLEKCARTQEPLSALARDLLVELLQAAMPDQESNQLLESGKYLSEDRAISLALDS